MLTESQQVNGILGVYGYGYGNNKKCSTLKKTIDIKEKSDKVKKLKRRFL